MKRKIIGAAAAYMSGLFFASFFAEGSDLLLLAGLLPVFYIIARLVKLSWKDAVMLAAFFGAAYCTGVMYNNFVYERIIAFDGKTGSFCGKITDVEFYDGEKASYTLNGRINGKQKARITVYGDAYDISYGDMMSLENCEFVIPDSDYLFNGESYYRSKNIFLSAENPEFVHVEQQESHWLIRGIENYRERIISDYRIKLGETRGSFLSGIVFGETDGLGSSEKTLMYRCGIGHVMAVSGLHVSIMAAMLMFIMNKLRLNRYVSFVLMNIFIMLMIIMVKAPVSVVRAAIMLDFMYSAKLFRRQNDTFNSLAAAVLLICISNPYVVLDQGFLLSISGTFGIGVFAPYMTAEMKSETLLQKLLRSLTAMFCVMLAVMPLSILFFDETSVISPVSNVLIMPLCIAAMLCGMLYVLSGGLISLLSVSGMLIDIILAAADKLGKLSITHFSCADGRTFAISILCAAFIILVQAVWKNRKYTALSVAGAFTVFIFTLSLYEASGHDDLKIAFLGRGNNAAVVLTNSGRTDIIDMSGHYKSPDYVRRYLVSNGISEIGALILTDEVQSQYASYSKALELVEADNILIAGSTGISAAEHYGIQCFGDSSFAIQNTSYTASFSDGSLTIEYGGRSVTLVSVKAGIQDNADIAVYYGNVTKNSEISCNGSNIYLDELTDIIYPYSDINNFEIIISLNGECIIRRL